MYEDDLEVRDDGTLCFRVRFETDTEQQPDLSLHLLLPNGYPESEPPAYTLQMGSTSLVNAGDLQLVENGLQPLFVNGEPVIYEWIIWLQENAAQLPSVHREVIEIQRAVEAIKSAPALSRSNSNDTDGDENGGNSSSPDRSPKGNGKGGGKQAAPVPLPVPAAAPRIDIYHGPTFTDRKSVFQAHLAAVESVADVRVVMQTLLEDNKIQRATHNMNA